VLLDLKCWWLKNHRAKSQTLRRDLASQADQANDKGFEMKKDTALKIVEDLAIAKGSYNSCLGCGALWSDHKENCLGERARKFVAQRQAKKGKRK